MGGGLLLALNLMLYLNAARIGISEAMAVRISLSSAGLWWAVFTIPPFMAVHNRGPAQVLAAGQSAVAAVLRQLAHTLREVRRYPQTTEIHDRLSAVQRRDPDGYCTGIPVRHDELKIPVSQLTLAILMVQFVAFFGAMASSGWPR